MSWIRGSRGEAESVENNRLVLKVEHLKTSFAVGRTRVTAVNDVSIEAYAGRTLGIVGESGCGKSVTAHSILRLLPANGKIERDKILFYGQEGKVYDTAKLRPDCRQMRLLRGKEIGMVFQDPMSSLNPVYRVGNQITEKLRQHSRLSKHEARKTVVELLAKLNIPAPADRFNDYPHQFSGGMKQRVMIAVAIVNNPSLLIADEPTTALDVTIQAQILELMKEIQQEYDSGIILITHNMGIVAEIADDIAVMYMGRIVERGTTRQIFTDPSHPYTQALLKSVPVLGIGSDKRLEPIRGVTPDPRFLPPGCPFSPRCDGAMKICTETVPREIDLGDRHMVSCYLYGEERTP
jgi:oligopeptide/dipeptide ABC transporter ATP-binding protein